MNVDTIAINPASVAIFLPIPVSLCPAPLTAATMHSSVSNHSSRPSTLPWPEDTWVWRRSIPPFWPVSTSHPLGTPCGPLQCFLALNNHSLNVGIECWNLMRIGPVEVSNVANSLSLLKSVWYLGVRSSATIEPAGRELGRTTGPMCASAEAVEKGRISLTRLRPVDCGGLGRATFVAIMQAPARPRSPLAFPEPRFFARPNEAPPSF